jgi:hypothetical protein
VGTLKFELQRGIQKHASMPKFRKFRLQNSKRVDFD